MPICRYADMPICRGLYREPAYLAQSFHQGSKPQHGSGDGERQEWHVGNEICEPALKWILVEIDQESQCNVLDPDDAQGMPESRVRCGGKTLDGKNRQRVGPDGGYPEEDERSLLGWV